MVLERLNASSGATSWSNSELPSVVAATLSTLACIWQMVRMRRLRAEKRNTLSLRQLWHLAVANILFQVFFMVYQLAQTLMKRGLLQLEHMEHPGYICSGFVALYSAGLMAMLLVEAMLAAGFVAAVYRKRHVLRAMDRCLWVAWVLSVGLGFGRACAKQLWFQYDSRPGHSGCHGKKDDWTFIAVMTVCVIICAVCYIFCSIVNVASTEHVQSRALRRARIYPLVTLLAVGPTYVSDWMYAFMEPSGAISGWMIQTTTTLLVCSGLFNSLTFYYQSQNMETTSTQRSAYAALADLHSDLGSQSEVFSSPNLEVPTSSW